MASLRIAFIVTAHHLPNQLARLASRLAVNGHTIIVHVDRKTPHRTYDEMVERCRALPGLTFAQKRSSVYWADFTAVRVALAQLERAVELGPFDYALMLSGQCYPTTSIAALERHLVELDGASQIEARPMPVPDWGNGMSHLLDPSYRIIRNKRLIFLPRRPPPNALSPHKGLAFWALHRDAVHHILTTVDRRPDLIRYFTRCVMPDEMFFSSIMADSKLPFRNEPTAYVDFQAMRARPELLTLKDLPAIRSSGKPFARKFDERIDSEVLDALDALATESQPVSR